MTTQKGYEGLKKDSFEEYILLSEDMDTCVKVMYKVIDDDLKYPALFLDNYNTWQKCRKLILQNPYNGCGHRLSNEITEAYNKIIDEYKSELYYTF